MNHQTFIQDHQSSLNLYFKKLNKDYTFEISSFNQQLKRKDETIDNLKNIIAEKDNKIKQLFINEKKLIEDYDDFTKVSLLKTAHKNYDKVIKRNSILLKQNEKYKNTIKKLKVNLENTHKIYPVITIKAEDIGKKPEDIIKNDIIDIADGHKVIEITRKTLETSKELGNEFKKVWQNLNSLKRSLEIEDGEMGKTDEKTDEEPDEETDEETDEEVELELLKINNKFYYVTPLDNDIRDIYKAIKINKDEYDVGNFIGIYENGIIVKE